MSLEKPTFVDLVLDELYNFAALLPRPFETPYQHSRRLKYFDPDKYRRTVRDLHNRGLLKVTLKNNKKFLQLTKKGELQVLLEKAKLATKSKWDGKWRLVMFDIPERSKDQRNVFRSLLKSNNFYKLQASVYISPSPLNREAIIFLNKTHLIDFIRILRIDEMDNDLELRKKFKLNG